MKRLLADIRDALRDVSAIDAPGDVPPSGAVSAGADLVDVFTHALEAASGLVVRVPDAAAAEREIDALAEGGAVARVEEPLCGEDELRRAAVGVSPADVLIAETGTVVRTCASAEEARVSLIPPITVFVASEDALVGDLPTALARIAAIHRAGSAYTIFTTGPSRTADIEKKLVIPAHGPREVVVLLVASAT